MKQGEEQSNHVFTGRWIYFLVILGCIHGPNNDVSVLTIQTATYVSLQSTRITKQLSQVDFRLVIRLN